MRYTNTAVPNCINTMPSMTFKKIIPQKAASLQDNFNRLQQKFICLVGTIYFSQTIIGCFILIRK